MAIERFIDYMQFSVNMPETRFIDATKYSMISPVRNYKRGYRDKWGIRYYTGNVRGGTLVIASGEIMENLRSLRNDYEILGWALEAGGKFSRIDLAVTEWNTFEGLVTLEDIEKWAETGLISSSLYDGTFKLISSFSEGLGRARETLYIGDMKKRARKGIFRAYDKGIELDLGQYMSTRIELELKREKAHKTALRIARSNDIAGNFRAYFDVRHKEFDRLMDSDAVSTKRGKALERVAENEENDRRWTWLLEQVAPALKEAIKRDRDANLGDIRLTRFLKEAGLLKEMIDQTEAIAKAKMHYRRMSTIELD